MCHLEFQSTPVVKKIDSPIHWINLYPVDNAIDFPSNSSAIQCLNIRGLVCQVTQVLGLTTSLGNGFLAWGAPKRIPEIEPYSHCMQILNYDNLSTKSSSHYLSGLV